jgi:hypothetical protein
MFHYVDKENLCYACGNNETNCNFMVDKFLQIFIKKKNVPSLGCQLHEIYPC